ncbi:MAG: cholesterol oxidase, partial [Chloroflexi bacterium]|nr:cholesterol oxidase [Chloroflexota bacterium]
VNRQLDTDYSEGIAITSIMQADALTHIEPVRYPAGSDLMRFLGGPMIESGGAPARIFNAILEVLRQRADYFKVYVQAGWASRTTILLVMQTADNQMRLRLRRSLLTLYQRGLVSMPMPEQPIPAKVDIGHEITRAFAEKTGGIPLGSVSEGLFNVPITAHILGGVPIGRDVQDGVVDMNFEVFNYPGLFVVDGSIVPANPGVNPSLTITALAEYAMSHFPPKTGG